MVFAMLKCTLGFIMGFLITERMQRKELIKHSLSLENTMTQNNSEILKLEFHRVILAFSVTHGEDGLDRWYNMAEVDCIFFVGAF